MHFPSCFNECLHTSQEVQENENKESSEEYLNTNSFINTNTFENNKTNSNASASLRNYYGAQGVASNEMAHWEKEIQLMTESVNRIYKALSDDTKVEDLFEYNAKEFENQKMIAGEDDLKASFEMIDKMDVLLRVKVTEEKKAKLSRIQVEEESRNILTKLPQSTWSNGIKINLEEFMRLLNEVEKTENGKSNLNDDSTYG